MSSLSDTTLGDVARGGARYGPYAALVAVVLLVVGLSPTPSGSRDLASLDSVPAAGVPALDGSAEATVQDDSAAAPQDAGGAAAGSAGAGSQGAGSLAPETGTSTAAGTAGAPAAGGGSTGAAPAARRSAAPVAGAVAAAAAAPKNCDTARGTVKIPTLTAPRCVPGFDGDNGGATYRGVTKDEVVVAVYRGRLDPAASAIAKAGGSNDSEAQIRQQYQDFVDLYQSTYETYGRKIKLVFVAASGEATDDSAARADALKVAKLGAFASLNAPNNTYSDELAARGILCIGCAIDQPTEYYNAKAPFVYGYGMSVTWKRLHQVQFVVKYLAGKKAVHAGDPLLKEQTRKLGFVWYDTEKGDYKQGRDVFVNELKKKGVTFAAEARYNGFPDTAKSQQQARPIIQKMKAAGVTTIIFSGDPFAPIFFTGEATRQQYFPEWSGSGPLVDTAFFSRLYDQQQWRNNFSQTTSVARLDGDLAENDRLLKWFSGRGPSAPGSYNLIATPVRMLLTGIHSAGERLTPLSYRDGLFGLPLKKGGKTFAALSYGTRLWPTADYTAVDDVTFLYWDPTARGGDENGNQGVGLYRYLNGGQRYLPADYPASVPFFQPAGTVTLYEDYPQGERPPDYPRPAR